MSTQIKNTLFRFVTMRTPELLEKDIVNQTFVKHPESEKEATATFESKFLTEAAKSTANYLSLVTVAKGFEPAAIKKRENLVDPTTLVSKEFYDFAIWLTSNRTTFKVEQLQEKITNFSKTNPLNAISNATVTAKLWENLLYQIITYKSNYVREAILSILVADFFLKNYGTIAKTDDAYRKLAQARVIIPNLFMNKLANKVQATTSNTLAIQKSQEDLTKQHQAIMATSQAEEIKALIQEIKNAESVNNKKTQQAYDAAFKQYELDREVLIQQALSAPKTTSSEATTIVPTTENPTSLGTTPATEMPYIKPFKFDKPQEIDLKVLQSQLSPLAFEQVQNFNQNLALETFGEMIQKLQEQVNVLQQTAITNTVPQEETLVNIGGVLLPAVPAQTTQKVFTITNTNLKSGAANSLNLLFNNSFDNQAITSANYELTLDGVTKFSGTSFQKTIGNNNNITIFLEKINLPQAKIFSIKGTFVLADGRKVEFEGKGTIDYKVNMLIESLTYSLLGQGTYTLSELSTSGDYIPPTYGIKRLGIADYRKVEQEICCYVPGEVSHIENVMASEYKDRTTRALQRREETNTFSKETETEKLTDTSTSNRFEMNQEVNNVLAEDTHTGMNSNFNASWGGGEKGISPKFSLTTGADFATNTTKEESNHQAVTSAKEVTERALDRIVQKVKEERVVKITNEFEETNTHGFDNRKNPNHISGVYRWVDKVYRNTVVNYGKRLMYEFMVPEPASFHNLALTLNSSIGEKLVKPIDPRTAESTNVLKLDENFDTRYKYWAENYNVIVQPMPEKNIKIGKSYAFNNDKGDITNSQKDNIQIPEKYTSQYVNLKYQTSMAGGYLNNDFALMVGNVRHFDIINNGNNKLPLLGFTNNVPVSISFIDYHIVSINIEIECTLTEEAKTDWRIKTFNAIMQAYQLKLDEYNEKLKQLRDNVKGTNPGFFRQYENTVLRKNCIDYLISHEALGDTKLKLVKGTNTTDTVVDYANPNLESYAAKVKFFEQSFEWNLMSYNFYPFYWADKNKWSDLYNVTEFNDPIFRAFLQSGMARVVVTVRPGFEEAVNWYMATGQIWNGGQVPTIDDPMYISIVDELRQVDGEVEETWETRVPTSLTILQAGSAGLVVTQALPCDEDCKDNMLFDSDGNAIGKENPFKLKTTTGAILGLETPPPPPNDYQKTLDSTPNNATENL